MINFSNENRNKWGGANGYVGEMTNLEREFLYNWVLLSKPKTILEIGTGCGGGGCYYMAKALQAINENGILYTCDPARKPNNDFFIEFPNVLFYQTTSNELIQKIIETNVNINFIFFDGPEDPNVAMGDILILEKHIAPGTKFSMHDWEISQRIYDNVVSTKAQYIRPYMEQSNKWKLLHQLENSYESVGLCLYEFLGN